MQKVIQRSKVASRRAAQRMQKEKDHMAAGQAWSRRQDAQRLRKFNHNLIVEARQRRQEDWAAGPLAPRRDVGEKAETYGSVPIYNFQLPDRHPERRPKWFPISEGDRVVVLRGREKGKIGEVDDINKEKATVRIKDVNVTDVSVPEWIQQEDQIQSMMSIPIAVPLEDVKLVYPLPDPATGILRDVIIDRLVCVNRQWDKVKKEWDSGERSIPGTKTLIPWPERTEPEHVDYPEDTLRVSVDEMTFRPCLVHPPMPMSVIDELRNKYSKFRTRHDWEYVQKKEAEDARVEKRKDLIKTMRTPLQELADVRAKEKAAREKDLTAEQLARIGQVIAQERARATENVRQMEQ